MAGARCSGMDGDEAIAWAEYGTPVELPTLHHLKRRDATRTADHDYRITCVFVDERHRRLGFTYDRPKGLKNCVMVKTVGPRAGAGGPSSPQD